MKTIVETDENAGYTLVLGSWFWDGDRDFDQEYPQFHFTNYEDAKRKVRKSFPQAEVIRFNSSKVSVITYTCQIAVGSPVTE